MAKLLHIQASPRGERSYSLRAARAFVEAYRESHPRDTVETLGLDSETVPDFGSLAVEAKYRVLHGDSSAPAHREAWGRVEKEIERFKAADKYVVSCPMWNFGIPHHLKRYVDVIVQPGYTFSYSPQEGYKGLVTGRRAMLILARGGDYGPESGMASYDLQLPYIRAILQFIGFADIDSVIVQPTLQGGREVAESKLQEAIAAAREKARSF